MKEKEKKVYDVTFEDETDSNNKGWSETYETCQEYIKMYNGSKESYFADYKNGTVNILNTETGEIEYTEKIY